MICLKRLFCNNRFLPSFLISLAVLSCTQRLNAEVYDVNITNNGVDVNVTSLPNNAYDFSNSLYDSNQFDSTDIQFGDDSPMEAYSASGDGGTPYGGASGDFQSTSYFQPNSDSYSPFDPTLSGRNPTRLTGKYFNFGGYWIFRTTDKKTYDTSPLQVHEGDASHDYKISVNDTFVIPGYSMKTSFFNFNQFKTDILAALLGSDNLNFFIRLFDTINSVSASTNFVYSVPPIFGFDSGFVLDIPLHDILHGSGDWTNLSSIISLFRSMMSLVYYMTVVYFICRCVFIHI